MNKPKSNKESVPAPKVSGDNARRIKSLSALCADTIQLCAQAKQKIQIYSRNLDPRILNNRELEKHLDSFIRSSRYVRIELLITDEGNLQGIDHRLVKLSQKYTSFVSIRVIPKDFHENHFAFYLVDAKSMIYRPVADRYEAQIHHLPSSKINQKAKYFDEIWQQSAPAVHLRALNL